jgi:hypothetical protein
MREMRELRERCHVLCREPTARREKSPLEGGNRFKPHSSRCREGNKPLPSVQWLKSQGRKELSTAKLTAVRSRTLKETHLPCSFSIAPLLHCSIALSLSLSLPSSSSLFVKSLHTNTHARMHAQLL